MVIFSRVHSLFCCHPSKNLEDLLYIFQPHAEEKGRCSLSVRAGICLGHSQVVKCTCFNAVYIMIKGSTDSTGDFKSVVLKSRRESAHARTFGGDFELKILRMRGFSSRFWTMDLKSPV